MEKVDALSNSSLHSLRQFLRIWRDALENGSPAAVWVDAFSLPYTNLPSDQRVWAMMPVLVHAHDGESFSVADRSEVSLKLSVEELMKAQCRVKKERFRVATFSQDRSSAHADAPGRHPEK